MADPLTIEYKNTGHKTIANVAGAIMSAGTPFFGAIGNVHPEDKRDFTSAAYALTAVDPIA
jgi:hypothetical protein